MSRRRASLSGRRLNDNELLGAFEQGLDTLAHLARTYDDGYVPIAFLMATEVQKILTENGAAARLRGLVTFSSPDKQHDRSALSPFHKLTVAQVSSPPPSLKFLPSFHLTDRPQPLSIAFRDWWHRDVIYRASAAPPGTPAGLLPVNGSPVVPFEKREKVTRMGLVNLLRNKLGAHQASEMPVLLDELDEAKNWGGFGIQTPDGVFSTDDGTLQVMISPIPAMMRQICHELLVAYGRNDSAPQPATTTEGTA